MSKEIYKLKYLKYKAKYLKLLGAGEEEGKKISHKSISMTTKPSDADQLIQESIESITKCINEKIKSISINYDAFCNKTSGGYYINIYDGHTQISHFSFHYVPRSLSEREKLNPLKSSWHYEIDRFDSYSSGKKTYNLYHDNKSIYQQYYFDHIDASNRDKQIMNILTDCTIMDVNLFQYK